MNEKKNVEVGVKCMKEPIDADDIVNRESSRVEVIEERKQNNVAVNLHASRYKKLSIILGEGSYKRVYKAFDEEEVKEVAWNEVIIRSGDEAYRDKTSLMKEVSLLKSLSHPNILKIFDYWYVKDSFVFITEHMADGTLRDYINNMGEHISINLIRKWSKQILEGLVYLHSQSPPIIHRDIKCDNIFVNASLGEVKIGDLGIAKEGRAKRYTLVGTPQFMAREMIDGGGYNEKVDVYAFGMCLIEMATGIYPYKECKNSSEIYYNIRQGVPPTALYSIKEPCLKNLILSCLVMETKRSDAKTALEHHFYDKNSQCNGDCVPTETILVQPLVTPCNDIEISLISYNENIYLFQLFFMCEAKYIKFEFDIVNDSIETLPNELINEGLIDESYRDYLDVILKKGIKSAIEKYSDISKQKDNKVIIEECKSEPPKIDKNVLTTKEAIEKKNKNFNIGPNINFNELEKKVDDLEINLEKLKTRNTLKSSQISSSFEIEENIKNFITPKQDVREIFECIEIPLDFCDGNQKINKSQYEGIDYPVDKYNTNCTIEQFVKDTAEIFNRTEEIATNWIKILKSHEIDTVFDLKYLVNEDWDKLGLTVFSSRAMKNMLYGFDKNPIKEKELIENTNFRTYDGNTDISDFLEDVASIINRKNSVSSWKTKLLLQDIRTVGELRSLHEDDLDRLGLSVFSCRMIKNLIFKKGKYP